MRVYVSLAVLHVVMALVPFIEPQKPFRVGAQFYGWPKWVSDMELTSVPLLPQENRWAERFPGKVGRFLGDEGEYLLRWIEQPTRSLHPIRDCLKGSGYQVYDSPLQRGKDGTLWGCVKAQHLGQRQLFCEQIQDEDGNTWSDVSSWYWAGILGRTKGPWWAVARVSDLS